ncbi:MAG: hypothetical protein H8E66_05425 [Planctomycetes bacterium]|nr:hypothetical protein [Planctomycetota bacterium]
MNRLFVLGVVFALSRAASAQEAKDVFAELDAEIEEQLSSDTWHPATKSFIRAQWADYKKAHEQPDKRGDFYGARCYGGIVCDAAVDDIKQYAGAYNFQGPPIAGEPPGPHLQIIVSPDNRVFVIEDGRRLPAIVNNNIIFFTDGTWVSQNAQLSTRPYARLEMTMFYKARYFGWVRGPADSYVDDMLRLVKLEKKTGTQEKTPSTQSH